ncbi:hypothetical protein M758_1G051600 [Ceratodon purpureus]|nr:hypothetical protein M758_1G051600 [Ceratodon purpureus]
MAMGVTSLLGRSAPAAACYDYKSKTLNVASSAQCSMSFGASTTWRRDLPSWSSIQFDPLRHAVTTQGNVLRSKRLTVAAASESSNGSPDGGKARQRTRAKEDVATLREKVSDYIEKKSGYFWLGGPILATAAVFIPPAIIPLVQLLQKNYLVGLLASFGLDILFVLAADLFFVLADKAGHHQTIAGGTAPWIGPWEYTGYPKGEPVLTKLVAYAGVAVGVLGVVLSLFVGKLAVGLPAFGSYLALIFVQVFHLFKLLLQNP